MTFLQPFMLRASPRMFPQRLGSTFALTPALSPRRERACVTSLEILKCWLQSPIFFDCAKRSRPARAVCFNPTRRMVLPLLGGEGRGEGKPLSSSKPCSRRSKNGSAIATNNAIGVRPSWPQQRTHAQRSWRIPAPAQAACVHQELAPTFFLHPSTRDLSTRLRPRWPRSVTEIFSPGSTVRNSAPGSSRSDFLALGWVSIHSRASGK